MISQAQRRILSIFAVVGMLLGAGMCWGQEDADPMPLGDLARSMRKEHQSPSTPSVIDNDNLSKAIDEIESRRMVGSSLVFSFDGGAKTFRVSSPDVTCSLSFNAQVTSLLSDPYVSRPLPESELAKLDGPATIEGDNLQVAVFNGTNWRVDEITVGFTVVKRGTQTARAFGNALLVPAASQTTTLEQRRPDVTTLYKMRAAAPPQMTTMFKAGLTAPLGADEEWHWGIVQAKGIPPRLGSAMQASQPATNQPVGSEPVANAPSADVPTTAAPGSPAGSIPSNNAMQAVQPASQSGKATQSVQPVSSTQASQ